MREPYVAARSAWRRTLALGIHCAALNNRLQASERDLEQARAQNKVSDVHVVRAAGPVSPD